MAAQHTENQKELLSTKSVFIVIKILTYAHCIPSLITVKCAMNSTANLIDFAAYRKRRQAQKLARAMWEVYARNAGYQVFQWAQAAQSHEPRQA